MPLAAVLGDLDSHDAPVLEGDSSTLIAGKPATYVGAAVDNDKKKHTGKTIVASGTSGKTTVGGKALAANGATVSCSATIIASATSQTFVS